MFETLGHLWGSSDFFKGLFIGFGILGIFAILRALKDK